MILEFYDGVKAYVDFDFLRQSYDKGFLKGSRVFGMLFCLEENTNFKKEEFNKNIFNDFHIRFSDWSKFLTFLKYGKLLDNHIIDVKSLNELSNKFGFIVDLDKYCINSLQIKNNPNKAVVRPEDDIEGKYIWKILTNDNINELRHEFKEFDCLYGFRQGITDIYYLRKLKDPNKKDINQNDYTNVFEATMKI
jgi:hypothetical protein